LAELSGLYCGKLAILVVGVVHPAQLGRSGGGTGWTVNGMGSASRDGLRMEN